VPPRQDEGTREFLKLVEGHPSEILLLTHSHADLDAVCSGVALKEALLHRNPAPSVQLGVPGSVSQAARRVLEALSEEVLLNPPIWGDLLILLDTSSLDLLTPLAEEVRTAPLPKAVIDHHAPKRSFASLGSLWMVEEEASSTCEIVYGLIESMEIEMTPRMGLALTMGILSDTAHLKHATTRTIQVLGDLLEASGARYEEALRILEVPKEISLRSACLRAAQRMTLHRIGGFLVATSRVGSYNAIAAGALVHLGADCAFVATERGEGWQVSGRATNRFLEATGIHLGKDVLSQIGGREEEGGGGHAGAAAAYGRGGDTESVLAFCVQRIEALLGRRSR
jgi:nanoRNase/pAp phosphatase (c-di-AMP/oligoRNAs hydrolase)